MASSVGAGDAERPVSHRGTTGRDAQRSDRAGPAKYYPEPQTRSAGSVAPAGDSERIAMQSRRTGTCDPVLLSASHSAARAAAARRAFQVEATGRQHVVRRQTCALACIIREIHPLPSQKRELQPQYVDPNIVFPHSRRNHVPGNACTSSNRHCDRQG